MPTRNLLSSLPAAMESEVAETLLSVPGIRIERIVSQGQASPDGYWYDQDEAEWVMLLAGNARLTIDGEDGERALGPGDAIHLPSHCRHRVTWTDPATPTVWLAVFFDDSANGSPDAP